MRVKASFDDGCQQDMRTAALLKQYGISDVVFYVPSDWHKVNRLHGDIPLTQEEVLDLDKRFSVGSHTISHPMLTRIEPAQIYTEVVESKAELELLLGHEVEDFCYPKGYANDDIRDVVRRNYKRARNTLVGNLSVPDDPVWESTTVHISGIRRKEYTNISWQDEARRLLQEAIIKEVAGEEVIFHFWGHSWEIDRHFEWGEFEKFLIELQTVIK